LQGGIVCVLLDITNRNVRYYSDLDLATWIRLPICPRPLHYHCFLQIEKTVVEQLGVARKVKVASTSTTLIADSASREEIEMRVAQVRIDH
jgi:hypothetical protein